jgi:hypothetical protein
VTPDDALTTAVEPALVLLPKAMDTLPARALLLAIGLQESRLEFRRQHGDGPARGLWQFEQGGGVKGIYEHDASALWTRALCNARNTAWAISSIWAALEYDDVLAAGCARLLLFTDPRPLPTLDDPGGAWDYYVRNWRPGKPIPATWAANHAAAVSAAIGEQL